jgi:hypothetical protein
MALDEGSDDDTQQFCEPSQEQAEVVACAARTTLMGSPRHPLRWRRIGYSWTKIASEPNQDPVFGVIGIQSDARATAWWINDLTRRHEIKSTPMDGEAARLHERYGRGDISSVDIARMQRHEGWRESYSQQ